MAKRISIDPIPEELIHVTDQNIEVREMRLAGKSQVEINRVLLDRQSQDVAKTQEIDPEIEQMLKDQEVMVDQVMAEIEAEQAPAPAKPKVKSKKKAKSKE